MIRGMKKLATLLFNPRTLILLYIVATVGVSLQLYLRPPKYFEDGGIQYTHYNNYIVFKQSHFHLLEGTDLYKPYPEEQWDLFKYSPAFAAFFGVFAHLPDLIGLILWNLMNSLIILYAIYLLPGLTNKSRALILLTIFIELITSLQNTQSNALVAGLIILTFVFLEKGNYPLVTLFIALSVFIKLFGIVAIVLFVFYPRKILLAGYFILWSVLLFLIPVLFTGISGFSELYSTWINLISSDHTASYGLSVMGWINTWFRIEIDKLITMVIGAVLLCLPLLRINLYKDYGFRILMLASLLLWVIIFNHKSESPTFIIAMTGIAIWFYIQPLKTINLILIILAFIFISLSPTDIFPVFIRKNYVIPYVLKVVPAIIIWGKIVYELGFREIALLKPEKS